MNYYPRFPGDYMRKTMHLSMLEDGAYGRLLDWYYANDRAIPHDRRYAVARASSAAERAAVDSVLGEFFRHLEGSHHNDRCDTEIVAAAKRIAVAKENGSKGGRKPKTVPNKNPAGNPVGSDPQYRIVKPIESSPTPSPYSLRSEETPGADAPSSTAMPPTLDGSAANDGTLPADLTELRAPKAKATKVPDCPHQEILTLFAEKLPMLSQPNRDMWGGSRQGNLRSRWKWLFTTRRKSGDRAGQLYAETAEQGIEWFARFFDVVAESDFLTGRASASWKCTLEWLVNETNFAKVASGNYENKAA